MNIAHVLLVASVFLVIIYVWCGELVLALESRGDYGSITYQALVLTDIGSIVLCAACWIKIWKIAKEDLKR